MVLRRNPRRATAPVELAPRTIREVEFRERVRGYDADQVDPFLDEVADRVDALQRELLALTGPTANRELGEPGPLVDSEEMEAAALVGALLHLRGAHADANAIIAEARRRARAIEHQARVERRVLRRARTSHV